MAAAFFEDSFDGAEGPMDGRVPPVNVNGIAWENYSTLLTGNGTLVGAESPSGFWYEFPVSLGSIHGVWYEIEHDFGVGDVSGLMKCHFTWTTDGYNAEGGYSGEIDLVCLLLLTFSGANATYSIVCGGDTITGEPFVFGASPNAKMRVVLDTVALMARMYLDDEEVLTAPITLPSARGWNKGKLSVQFEDSRPQSDFPWVYAVKSGVGIPAAPPPPSPPPPPPPPPSYISVDSILDTFTDTGTIPLAAHTPDLCPPGYGWSTGMGYNANGDTFWLVGTGVLTGGGYMEMDDDGNSDLQFPGRWPFDWSVGAEVTMTVTPTATEEYLNLYFGNPYSPNSAMDMVHMRFGGDGDWEFNPIEAHSGDIYTSSGGFFNQSAVGFMFDAGVDYVVRAVYTNATPFPRLELFVNDVLLVTGYTSNFSTYPPESQWNMACLMVDKLGTAAVIKDIRMAYLKIDDIPDPPDPSTVFWEHLIGTVETP
jgi:hypothetical protein